MAEVSLRLNTGRDYVIAGVALAIVFLALLFTANSLRTSITTTIG